MPPAPFFTTIPSKSLPSVIKTFGSPRWSPERPCVVAWSITFASAVAGDRTFAAPGNAASATARLTSFAGFLGIMVLLTRMVVRVSPPLV